MYLHPDLKAHFSSTKPLFDQMMALEGEVFRHQDGRKTQRVFLGDKSYFIKQHAGVGWKEIFKNIIQFKYPVISAKNEWQALAKLQRMQISAPQVMAFGERGSNPAKRESFILMEDLTQTISLEDLTLSWKNERPPVRLKQQLIYEVAKIAQAVHQHGMNHRDFYICHFLLSIKEGIAGIDSNHLKLYLIDLHRAQLRHQTPKRWIIKDLAGLYFSSKDIGLTKRDLLRFMRTYSNQSLRDIFKHHNHFWQKVIERGEQLYGDHSK